MDPPQPDPAAPKHERRIPPVGDGLIPSSSLFTTTMIVVGGVIGSGIFRKPGVMASEVGSPELLLLVWLVAGVLTLFRALAQAQIAPLISQNRGGNVYFWRTSSPVCAFPFRL